MAVSIEVVREYIGLTKQADEVEAQLKSIKARMETLSQAVTDYFIETGIQNMSIDERQIYLRNDIFATVKKSSEALDELRFRGYGDKISETVHASSAKAIVRELCNGGTLAEAPPWVAEVFDTYEKPSVVVRR